ncbi:C39 family peptidase [Vagococcus silagei]|uniref:Peptidase C39-like domain-containing protein n=1 Tax=Vagococcus silagei TaxID=2508885 RepID=A0A4S3B000_9ENTE|nr:C39 family peptidase [Vagococcus silagei]THB60331.1 hypothetical protein ESZ54_10800 [Vagococcus silagei]
MNQPMKPNQTNKQIKKKRAQFIMIMIVLVLFIFGVVKIVNSQKKSALDHTEPKQIQTTTSKIKTTESSANLPYELTTPAFSQKAGKRIQERTKNKDLKLIIQTDERWGTKFYGTDEKKDTIAQNGCAIAVLAMIDSYWQKKNTSIDDILKWSGNQYFHQDQGTDWIIFPMFAEEFGYQVEQTLDFDKIEKSISDGIPIVVSVSPGTFTDNGHFLILFADSNGKWMVLDPNDSPKKKHYEQNFDRELFQKEALNFWIFTK